MIDTETKAVSELEGLAGGVMAVIPIPEHEGEFLSIQKFYPIFDSRKSTGGSLPHLGGNIPEDAGRGIGGSGYSVCTPDRTCRNAWEEKDHRCDPLPGQGIYR